MSSTDFEHLGYRITQDDTDGMVWIQSPAGAVIDRAPFVSEAVEMVDALARAPWVFDAQDACRSCGEHISDPHAPACPYAR